MLLLRFLLEDLAVTSKLKIRARYIERMEINEEKISFQLRQNGKFLPKRRIFLEMTTQWQCNSLMHSLLSEHYLYWRKETQCGISFVACLKNKKKIHEQTFIVCKWGDWDTDKGWRLQTITPVICILLVCIKLNENYICFKQKSLAGIGKAVWNIKRIFKLVFSEWNH